jgi:hypothetical protein
MLSTPPPFCLSSWTLQHGAEALSLRQAGVLLYLVQEASTAGRPRVPLLRMLEAPHIWRPLVCDCLAGRRRARPSAATRQLSCAVALAEDAAAQPHAAWPTLADLNPETNPAGCEWLRDLETLCTGVPTHRSA